jgi:hypothetical protein
MRLEGTLVLQPERAYEKTLLPSKSTLLEGKISRSHDHKENQERGYDNGGHEPVCSCLPPISFDQAKRQYDFR